MGPATTLRFLPPGDPRAEELVTELAARGSWEALYALALVIAAQNDVSEAARAAADAILRRTSPFELPTLDADLRWQTTQDVYATPWSRVAAKDVARLAGGPARTTVLGLLSMHPSGFVREAAVRALAGEGDRALPWLLVRTVDWVLVVRSWAAEGVRARIAASMSREHADAVRACLPLAQRLRRFTRAHVGDLVDAIERFLLAQPSDVLARGLTERDARERRACFALLDRAGRLDEAHLEVLLASPDRLLRVEGARRLVAAPTPANAARRAALAQDRSGAVRVIALEAAPSLDRDVARAILLRATEDPLVMVRYAARLALSRLDPSFDARAHHLAALEHGRVSVGLVRAIGDVGVESDWEGLVPLLDGQTSAIACAALQSIAHLAPAASHELRLMLVDDPRPRVSATAAISHRAALRPSDGPIVASYFASPHLHVPRRAVLLANKLGGWAPITLWLGVKDPALVPLAETSLRAWIRTRYVSVAKPAHDEAAAVRAALEVSALEPGVRRTLSAFLDFVAK